MNINKEKVDKKCNMNTISEPYNFAGKTFYFGVETNYGKDLEKNIKYIVSCNYQESETNDDFIVSLERKQFFIDGIEPQKLVDQLADACIKILYPIECRVTKKGAFVEFLSFEALRKRMQEGIPKIRQQYKGGHVNEYIQQIATNFESKENLSKALLNDPLYHILFINLFMSKEELIIKLPIEAFKPAEKFYGNTKAIEEKNEISGIYFKGEAFNKHSLEVTKLLNNDDYSLQKIEAKYEDNFKENSVNYIITRLKEREQEDSKFYIKEEEEEIEVKPKKKKKKWLLF